MDKVANDAAAEEARKELTAAITAGTFTTRPTPPASLGLASGARRPYGPEASGIKAGWPRFDKKRGAQPASPTAVRRDVLTAFH